MKNTTKKLLALFLVLTMTVGSVPLSAFAELKLPEIKFYNLFDFSLEAAASTGSCGTNTKWSLNKETETLTIFGTGKMYNYSSDSEVPWFSQRHLIKTVIISEGVTTVGNESFYDCYNLTNVIIGNSVLEIGYNAFLGCDDLTTVTIGNSVETIGECAFSYCSKLTSVTIPDGVKTIGDRAFIDCSSLTDIHISDSVIYIGSQAFDFTGYYYNSSNWEKNVLYIGNHLVSTDGNISGSYSINPGTKTIAGNAFYGSDNLAKITIPNSVITIGAAAFYSCGKLESITIPNSVTLVGDYAFYYCDNLSKITIPNSVTTIGAAAFYSCDELESITIPNSVTTIGAAAFYGCDRIKKIVIPYSVKTVGNKAFACCHNLTDIIVDIENQHYSSDSYGVLFNKSKTQLIQYPIGNIRTNYIVPNSVTTICDSAFEDAMKITSIEIPNSVKSLGHSTFESCKGLLKIAIPNNVTHIGDRAFFGCSKLTNIMISDSVTNIGYQAFTSCSSLVSIIVDAKNQFYSSDSYGVLFKNETELIKYPEGNTRKSYAIPDNITTVGAYAFDSCYNLTSIIIPEGVTSIEKDSFSRCMGLTDIIIPKTVKCIDDFAFYGCNNLTSITIPNGIATIEWGTFASCKSLTNVTIPNSVTTIGSSSFEDCDSLTDVYYTGEKEEWEKVFIAGNNTPLTKATIHYNSATNNNKKTKIFVNKDSLNFLESEDIVIAVIEEEGGKYYTPEKITVTNSDDSVVTLKGIYDYSQFKNSGGFSSTEVPSEYRNGKFIVMNAKKSGMSVITVNNNETKDVYSFPISVAVDDYINLRADKIPTYDYKIPQLLVDDEYNAYYNGMYITDLSYKRVTGGWYFDMNIYNTTHVCGVVEVYDKAGKLLKVEKISKFENTGTGLIKTLGTGWSMLTELFTGELCSFRGVSFSKETKIKNLYVPQDGYVKITNDSAASTMCFVLNLFDAVLTGASMVKDVWSFSQTEIGEIENTLLGEFVKNEYYLKFASKYQEKLTKKAFESITEASFASTVATLAGEANGLLMDIDLDFDDIIKTALGTTTGIGEGILLKYADVFGLTLNTMFTAQKVLNYVVQLNHWQKTCGNGTPFGFVTPFVSSANKTLYSGDKIGVDTNGNVPSETILQTYRVLKDTISVELEKGELLNDFIAYDVSLVKDGKITQPSGNVKVYIPFPMEFKGSKIQVVRQNEDGSWSLIDSVVENGVITFAVNHFCVFAIVRVGEVNSVSINDMEINYKNTANIDTEIKADDNAVFDVKYSTSNPSVATVDENGVVTATGTGETEITVTVTDEYGNVVEDTCKVAVSYAWWQWLIIIFLFGWIWY